MKRETENQTPTSQSSAIGARAADDPELIWFQTVYKGDTMPQLTVRAVVMGAFLGGFMSLSNLYVGLKTGWGLGVAITACILSFSINKTLSKTVPRLFGGEMSILENNCMQSTASSAGYSTGGTMVSAVSAYLLITGHHIAWPVLAGWTVFLAALGVFMAIPMKRQMINIEQLKFPSGIAAAETLRSLHAEGGDSAVKARSLGIAGVLGAAITWLREAGRPFRIPDMLHFPGQMLGIPLVKWTISFEMSTIMIAAGAIMGWKIAWSMLLGGVINYTVLAPWMVKLGVLNGARIGYREIVAWSTWTGAAIMVTSALLQFAFNWRTIGKAFSGVAGILLHPSERENGVRRGPRLGKEAAQREGDPLARIEVPPNWFLSGTVLSGLGCIAILYWAFHTRWWMSIIAVLMTFFLSVVACRATGESDITPIGAMGKITQLMFGWLAPANMVTNLMTAGMTAGAAGASADLLTDLKSGYLLGANPRKQFIAQFLGIFAGVLIIVPAFYVIVPTASVLGSDEWPAPSAQVWAAVARLLSNGVHSLHPTARAGLLIGGAVGILLPLVERAFPKLARFVPSATGVGLAFVIPFFNSLSMFLGALIALILEHRLPKVAERFVIPVSSGLIAGESLTGIVVALLNASGRI
ncbi:MAG: OPT family oligopeptide transporter [Candidatus Korobacteraceae bacterium]